MRSLGNFTSYTETDGYADVKGNRPTVELYGQDTWKVSRTLTVDYGMRFLWFRPWASTKEGTRSASWDPDRYIPGGSPLLYTPVRVNNQNFAQNPVTGELRAPVYVGSFVPNTGDPYNGMVTNDEWPTLWRRLPREPGHSARGPGRPRVGHHGQRQDLPARQPRPVPQRLRQCERARRPGAAATGAEQPGAALRHHRTVADARGARGVRYDAEQHHRVPARGADAEVAELLDRRPAGVGLGHGARRHLRGQQDARTSR